MFSYTKGLKKGLLAMDKSAIHQQLQYLINEITNPLKNNKKPKIQSTKLPIDDTGDLLNSLQLCIKYLMLDLEATRRERNFLKSKLINPPPEEMDDENDDEPNSIEGEM